MLVCVYPGSSLTGPLVPGLLFAMESGVLALIRAEYITRKRLRSSRADKIIGSRFDVLGPGERSYKVNSTGAALLFGLSSRAFRWRGYWTFNPSVRMSFSRIIRGSAVV